MKRLTAVLTLLIAATLVGAVFYSSRSNEATTPVTHVVVIMEENHSTSSITSSSMPYLTGLGNTYAHGSVAAISHPSLPNYFAFTSGSTQGVSSDSNHITSANNIYHQAGSNWQQLSESMKVPCQGYDSQPYVVHHAVPPFYSDLGATCKTDDIPLVKSSVPSLANKTFTFITPNNNDNGHSASLSAADAWLKVVVPQIMKQAQYQSGATLIEITFDEGSGSDNHVYTAFINPALSHKVLSSGYSHYSTLRLNEELLGFPLLAGAANAKDMRANLGL